MNLSYFKRKLKVLFTIFLLISLASCHNRNPRKIVSLTGWSDREKGAVGFSDSKRGYSGQEAPPGMVAGS